MILVRMVVPGLLELVGSHGLQLLLTIEQALNHSDDLLRAFAASDAEKMEVQRQKLVTTFERIEAPTCSSK